MTRVAREPLEYVAAFYFIDLEVYQRVLHGRRRGRRRARREPSGVLFSPKAYRNGQKTLDHRHPHIIRPFVQRRGLPTVQRTKAGVAPLSQAGAPEFEEDVRRERRGRRGARDACNHRETCGELDGAWRRLAAAGAA